MSGLDNLKTRLNYAGGAEQQGRMMEDKLRTLKKTLLYSYQAETIVLADGREFRCLLNPDKLDPHYDNKIISIPFADICLNKEKVGTTTEGIEDIGMKPGDIFVWKNNGSHWLVYMQYLEELAYFRADCRLCEEEQVDLNGKKYYAYVHGPTAKHIDWSNRNNTTFNDPNYDLVMYLTKDKHSEDFVQRFSEIKFDGKTWRIEGKNTYFGEGVIEIFLKEYYGNSMKDLMQEPPQHDMPIGGEPYIEGDSIVYPYSTAIYIIKNTDGGIWSIDSTKVKILESNDETCKISIITGKKGQFNLIYSKENEEDIILPITIGSL